MPEGFSAIFEALPESTREELPEGMDSDNLETVGEAVEKMAGVEYLLSFFGRALGVELGSSFKLLVRLCGLLILGAVMGLLGSSFGSKSLEGAFRFATTTAIFAAILHTQIEHLKGVEVFFERLNALMGGMIPVAGAVWAMGGNVSTASVGTGVLYAFLTVCENLCARTVMPVCCFCMALSLTSCLAPELGVKNLVGATKKIYTFLLGMIMTILVASLASQTALTAAADTTAARAAKMVSSTVIPVVGGSVGETLRTVAAGVQYLKSVVGIGGILLVAFLLLPTLLSLIMTRLVFLLASGIAEILGCENEGKLLSELGNLYGCMIAVVSMSSVMFILALTIFVKSMVAIS